MEVCLFLGEVVTESMDDSKSKKEREKMREG